MGAVLKELLRLLAEALALEATQRLARRILDAIEDFLAKWWARQEPRTA